MSATAAFDAVAATYDQTWTNTPVGRAQRDLVWRAIDPLFRRGDRVLDIGCGTGEDAAHLAARGVTVHAIDGSAAMVREAARRGGFTTAVARAEDLAGLRGSYDGALSNFGALNCVEDLPAVARGLAGLVRPGGRVAICTIGRFCAWELLYYAARFQFRKSLRRLALASRSNAFAFQVGQAFSPANLTWLAAGRRKRLPHHDRNLPAFVGQALCACPPPGQAQSACPTWRVYYPSVADLRAAFSPAFQCTAWTGVGLFVPPSYVHLPAPVIRILSLLDRILARVPLLRALADHRLLILVRK